MFLQRLVRPTMAASRLPVTSLLVKQIPMMQFGFKIKVNKNPLQSDLDFLKADLPKPTIQIEAAEEPATTPVPLPVPECFYPNTHEKPIGKQCKAMRTKIRHSVYKLAMVARLIQGKHIYDA